MKFTLFQLAGPISVAALVGRVARYMGLMGGLWVHDCSVRYAANDAGLLPLLDERNVRRAGAEVERVQSLQRQQLGLISRQAVLEPRTNSYHC